MPKPSERSPKLPEPKAHGPWFRALGLPLSRLLAAVILFVFGPLRTRGSYRVPKSGGLLILANHRSDVDPIVVQLACPRPVHFMAKSELFEMPILGPLIRWYRAFPVRRGEPDRAALKHAIQLLKMGEVVCVFPEGELSESGEMLPLKPGVSLLARASGVPTLCLGLVGTAKILPYGSLVPRPAFGGVEAVWGEVFPPEAAETDASYMASIAMELEGLSSNIAH